MVELAQLHWQQPRASGALFRRDGPAVPDGVGGASRRSSEEGIDLGRYFDENRGYFLSLYGTYITVWIVACFILVFVRLPRWTSGAFLLITLGWLLYGYGWWSKPLTGPA